MQHAILKNFSLLMSGQGYAGQIEQLSLPKLIMKTEDFQLGGLDSPVKMDMGLEPMSCEMTLIHYDRAMITGFGSAVGRHHSDALKQFNLKGACQRQALAAIVPTNHNQLAEIVPVSIKLSGTWQSLDFGNWKQGELAKLVATINVRYYQLKIGDEILIEIDIDNMTRQVDGADKLSDLQSLL